METYNTIQVKDPTINPYKQQAHNKLIKLIQESSPWRVKVQIMVPSMDQTQQQTHTISVYIVLNKS